jgi:hypothetical protein
LGLLGAHCPPGATAGLDTVTEFTDDTGALAVHAPSQSADVLNMDFAQGGPHVQVATG